MIIIVVTIIKMSFLIMLQVLDCFSTVSVLALSSIFLKVRYQCIHYSGVLICLAGIACLVVADYYGSRYYGSGGSEFLFTRLILNIFKTLINSSNFCKCST